MGKRRPCPYNFAARSRADMVAYLTNRNGRHGGHNYPARGWYPFAWNVKAYNFDSSGKWPGEATNPEYDSAWAAEVESDRGELFAAACENAARHVAEGDWTSYPGDDQGDWAFAFGGRSGGWLLLESWRGNVTRYDSPEDLREFLDSLAFADLRALYRGIVCADSDFARDKVESELAYQYHFLRTCWEENNGYTVAQRDAALTAEARDLEASRPDMYGWASMADGLPLAPNAGKFGEA